MAVTRFYFDNTNHNSTTYPLITSPGALTPRGSWDYPSSFTSFFKLLESRSSSASSTTTINDTTATNPYSRAITQPWVSAPLAADKVVGATVAGVLGVYESNAAADAKLRVHIYVGVGDTDAVRGTVVDTWVETSELGTSSSTAGRTFDPTPSEVAASAGDRIIVEIGTRFENSVTTSYNAYFYKAGNSGDLAAGGNATAAPGWLDISLNDPAATINPPLGDAAADGSSPTVVDHTPTWYVFPPSGSASATTAAPAVRGRLQVTGSGTDWTDVFLAGTPDSVTNRLYRIGYWLNSVAEVEQLGDLLGTYSGPHDTVTYHDEHASGLLHGYALVRDDAGTKTVTFLPGDPIFQPAPGPVSPSMFLDPGEAALGSGGYIEPFVSPWTGSVRPYDFGDAAEGLKLYDRSDAGGSKMFSSRLALPRYGAWTLDVLCRVPTHKKHVGVYLYMTELQYYTFYFQADAYSHDPIGGYVDGAPADSLRSNHSTGGAHFDITDPDLWVWIRWELSSSGQMGQYAKNIGDTSWTLVYQSGTINRSFYPNPTLDFLRWDDGLGPTPNDCTWDVRRLIATGAGFATTYGSPGGYYTGDTNASGFTWDSSVALQGWGDSPTSLYLRDGATSGVIRGPLISPGGVHALQTMRAYTGCFDGAQAAQSWPPGQRVRYQVEDSSGGLIGDTYVTGNSTGVVSSANEQTIVDLRAVPPDTAVRMRITLESDTPVSGGVTTSPQFKVGDIEWREITSAPTGTADADGYAPTLLDIRRIDIPTGTAVSVADAATIGNVRRIGIPVADAAGNGYAPVVVDRLRLEPDDAGTAVADGWEPTILNVRRLDVPIGEAGAFGETPVLVLQLRLDADTATALGYDTTLAGGQPMMPSGQATGSGYTPRVIGLPWLDIPAATAVADGLAPTLKDVRWIIVPTGAASAAGTVNVMAIPNIGVPQGMAVASGYMPLVLGGNMAIPVGDALAAGYLTTLLDHVVPPEMVEQGFVWLKIVLTPPRILSPVAPPTPASWSIASAPSPPIVWRR